MPRLNRQKNSPYFIISTASSKKEAHQLSRLLLQRKLAACVNIVYPIQSFFWWRRRINRANEALLLIKTVKSQVVAVESLLKKHHSYDVPEIIGWPIQKINQAYFDWLMTSLR
ncbi:MAG: cytochrome C biogenesis protein CcdA [Candidatus Omnitrophica bacterium CG11_big_fil_rev_8_21_14_0_20_45_26]|uniref:Cytochrome C biogenesis protein CcdA n=1 Tax=Candidatus Abzuiibacterium crystallinum TaxID=1974748 RepID=A0A2H0LLM8_9BACT|nr:MAG: cytochrome C biogenesis protein CcdA [Candidatus Omnitrophica bacterium CG11_big_fil_rev_8_21_14_0_20_45_26]PIW63567.1 MAG: cytochrome C biogenesis protein CcdA [Candidatus Omnitrophica bacterium CG12_big_fil_rev_8_21_14_0_65_45_16]